MAPSTRTSKTAGETADAGREGTVEAAPVETTAPEVAAKTAEPTEAAKGDTNTRKATVVQFVGHPGTERIITKADQDRLIGVKGVAKEDLVWAPGNTKIEVDVDEEVLAYLKSDEEFKVRELEVPNTEQA